MTVPFWCLFIACVLPFVWPAFSFKDRVALDGRVDNEDPRVQQARLPPGQGARAVAASANAFEALPVFASAVFVNHLLQGDATVAAALSVAWVVLRVAHGVFYLMGRGSARSASFGFAMFCAIGLFLHPVFS